MSFPIIKFVTTAALRDKILITFLVLILIIASLSGFFGSAAITEQPDFALVYKAGSLRMAGIASLVLFVCFYVRRAFETKEVEYLLTSPLTRFQYIISHAVSFALIAALLAVAISLVILLTAQPDTAGWMLWSFSLVIEYVLVALIGMFFSLVVPSAAGAALICFAFYTLARMIGVLLGISSMPTETTLMDVLGKVMEIISILIPRFDLMGQSEWLVYGPGQSGGFEIDRWASDSGPQNIGLSWFVYLQAVGFSTLIIIASAFDFSRKQF